MPETLRCRTATALEGDRVGGNSPGAPRESLPLYPLRGGDRVAESRFCHRCSGGSGNVTRTIPTLTPFAAVAVRQRNTSGGQSRDASRWGTGAQSWSRFASRRRETVSWSLSSARARARSFNVTSGIDRRSGKRGS